MAQATRSCLESRWGLTPFLAHRLRVPLRFRPKAAGKELAPAVRQRSTAGSQETPPQHLLRTFAAQQPQTGQAAEYSMLQVPRASWVIAAAAGLACASLAQPSLMAHAAAMVPQVLGHGADLSIPGVVGDNPLREGFVSGFLLIFFSELGDKTFFIALLLALRQPRTAVFAGTFSALAVMTVISVLLGQVLHQLDELLPTSSSGPRVPLDDVLAAGLLIWFGVKTLQDAGSAEESAAEEKEEAKEAVEGLGTDGTLALVLSTFALVFAAEWGDKSFLATIALAAASSPAGVVAGAIAGHGVATGLAVVGGGVLSQYFSERVLQYCGGALFLVFAAATVIDIVRDI